MNKNLEINIAHLYPDLLNIYGDLGNICALKKRLEWRNIKVNIDSILQNSCIDYKKYDIYFIGGGQDKQQEIVSVELQKHKNSLKEIAEDGTIFLGICGGYQLLGNYYEEKNGKKISGISLLDVYTISGDKRCIGNVTVQTDFLTPDTLVGFENHIGLTYLENETKALGKAIIGHGNNLKDKEEGARYKNVFGTYLHGSLLPKNPAFCDYLLELAIARKLNDSNYKLEKLDDYWEDFAHSNITNKKY